MLAVVPKMFEWLAGWFGRAANAFEVCGPESLARQFLLETREMAARLADFFRRLLGLPAVAWTVATPQVNRSPSRKYELATQLAAGDLADIYLATADETRYVLKIAPPAAGGSLLANEARQLKLLTTRCGKRHYREYLPELLETFVLSEAAGDRHVNAFAYREGFYTLEAIRHRHPAGLEARHLAWIFKRMMAATGFAHSCGIVHGAILPPHVMLHAENHGLQLVDWIQAVRSGSRLTIIPTTYRDWYPGEVLRREPVGPATDIYLAAKCLIYAAGGDPVAGRWPDAVPEVMRRFVNTCLFAVPRMRPQNAWNLHAEFDELLQRLFGSPKYHQLVMS